ncbi:hypothetical protein V1460_35160 [Streptomyces sp. SCSIO 30461]|uniref:hypothetical protein n=1 Tax=Streptomyces sp. SCSIO 30461 TaxID=3118085 RepID=UPI0030D0C9C0
MRRSRALIIGTVGTCLLIAAATGCGPGSSTQGKTTAPSAPTPASLPSAPAALRSPSAGPTLTPTASATTRSASRTAAPPSTPAAVRPPVPTYLAMSVVAPGGRLTLEPGGPAREFTVTLRNGNSRSYRHLLLAFQMEAMPGASANPAYILESWDPTTGTWRSVTLRIANDALPHALLKGGTPLARSAVATHRYRLRAESGAPPGPNPILIGLIDTDVDAPVDSTSLAQSTVG